MPVADPTVEDRWWLEAAIDLSRKCPPSASAFSVGAIVVDADGVEIARGFSRETERYRRNLWMSPWHENAAYLPP